MIDRETISDRADLFQAEERLQRLQSALEHSRRTSEVFDRNMLPVMEELQSSGCPITSTDELPRVARECNGAVPILLKWLNRLHGANGAATIFRALNIPSKRNIIVPALLDEFELLSGDEYVLTKWQVAVIVDKLANDTSYDRIKLLVGDVVHGQSREPLIWLLGKMKKNAPDAIQFLTGLLQQDDLPGHVMIALRKLKGVTARSEVTSYLTNKSSWLRREAKKTLATFDKVEGLTSEPGAPGQPGGAK